MVPKLPRPIVPNMLPETTCRQEARQVATIRIHQKDGTSKKENVEAVLGRLAARLGGANPCSLSSAAVSAEVDAEVDEGLYDQDTNADINSPVEALEEDASVGPLLPYSTVTRTKLLRPMRSSRKLKSM